MTNEEFEIYCIKMQHKMFFKLAIRINRIWRYLTEWNWRVYPPWNMTRDWWEGR